MELCARPGTTWASRASFGSHGSLRVPSCIDLMIPHWGMCIAKGYFLTLTSSMGASGTIKYYVAPASAITKSTPIWTPLTSKHASLVHSFSCSCCRSVAQALALVLDGDMKCIAPRPNWIFISLLILDCCVRPSASLVGTVNTLFAIKTSCGLSCVGS